MGKPDPPTPPNPLATARAQTGTNVSTAVANAYLGNINQNTPTGSLVYNQSGQYGWTDPTTGQTYNIPTFTATQTLSPQGQAIQAQTQAAQYNLAGMANAQSGRIAGLLSQNMNPSFNAQAYLAANPDVMQYALQTGQDPAQFAAQHYAQYGIGEGRTGWQAPQGGNAQNILNVPGAATSYTSGGPIQMSLGPQGAITHQYGGADDYSADRQRVEDALMQRMNPQLQIQQQALQQQLADQGIRYGSDAYNNAMLTYNQQANDARWGAIQQAGQEQQRMDQMAAQQAAFQNQAQNQAYEQSIGAAGFANQAQNQANQQAAQAASFYNTGIAQQLQQQQAGFNAAQAARNQYLQEQYASRNQPINEITSLLSGSQVTQPNFVNTPGAQIPTTDIAGLINQNFNQQMQNYQAQSQSYNTLVGGILGLGAGALKLSDVRAKDDIHKLGTIFGVADVDHDETRHDQAEGLPIYRYSYKDDPASVLHVGPMAQDVEKIDPQMVRTIAGQKYIDQSKLMGHILRAA